MRIVLLPIGRVRRDLLAFLRERIEEKLGVVTDISKDSLQLPRRAYNPFRRQYLSTIILRIVASYAIIKGYDKVLGIVDEDAYVDGLNFVFGEAILRGRAAVIYLPRLRQSFYGLPEDEELFFERALKESLHELGHTFGLGHCSNSRCVMHFSNSIIDTDRKMADYCSRCLKRLPSFQEVG